MLSDYNAIMAKVLAAMDKITGVTGGEADDVDLAELDAGYDGLANACFGRNTGLSVMAMVAHLDAYDFSSAHSRLARVSGMDRAGYYEAAKEEYAADKRRLQFFDAALKTFEGL